VNYSDRSFGLFFAASVALHVLVLLSWPRSVLKAPDEQAFQVALFPERREPAAKAAPPEPRPSTAREARPAARRPEKPPATIAKKNTPAPAPTPQPARRETPSPPSPAEAVKEREPTVDPPSAEPPEPEDVVVSERRLPTFKQLLPPPSYSAGSASRSPAPAVSLNTRDPQYVTYMTRVKQSIEVEWQYPEMARRYGLQGTLALEFTILGNGQLEGLRLVRSSGSALLDEEGIRAIKAAAPFPPLPAWIKPNPLPISATMEYRDSRLNYRFTR
jgi:protein TonB